jgi:penicillin-binding protein 1C
MKRKLFFWLGLGIFGIFIAIIISVFIPLPQQDFSNQSVQSLRIVDRNGILLREYLNDQQGRGEWKHLTSISPALQKATVAVEDKRFFSHFGIDPIAVMRSIGDNIAAMRFKSGGSTLTQQVIRNVYHYSRTVPSKIVEMWDAVRLERMFSKDEILEQYLNRSPYGNQLFGVEAASQWYFGKPVGDLSLAESAFLAALPNAPSILNPHKNFEAALARQRHVLQRMMDQMQITQEEYQRALIQPIQIIPPEAHFKAPHVASMIEAMNLETKLGTVKTTIDYPLQEQVQWLMRGHLKKLANKNVHNAAVIVIENSTGEILALIGSANFFDSTSNGQMNGVTAQRQPGSAIKPFMYALALEHGLTPATLLADIPTAIPDHHGDYVPENYDKHYHGPVRLRTALACSYNVPAVRTLQLIGKSALLEKLKDVGCTSLVEDAEFYGYGLTLGNAEVSLIELTTAYMSFANGGEWKSSKLLPGNAQAQSQHRVFDKTTAYLVTDILKDASARRPAFGGNFYFPFQCAVKTGTTKDYKDNWTVGYTTRYTVGVWVGNFNGSEMRRVSGVSGAGPIFTDVMTFLHSPPYGQAPTDFNLPDHLEKRSICTRSGKIPTSLCKKTVNEWFVEGKVPSDPCDIHREYVVDDDNGIERKCLYEVFPPEYSSWVLYEGLTVPPPNAKRLLTKSKDAESVDQLMIVSPNSGDYFKIDPVLRSEYQTITIAGFIPSRVSQVMLRVNESQDIPFNEHGVEWKLRKGVYRFQLCGYMKEKQVVSKPVVINVE